VFDPKNFFLSLLHLVSGTNQQGYSRALRKAWHDIGDTKTEPVKSSLSKIRARISYQFFADKFNQLTRESANYRKKFRGFYVYAVDGQESALPISESILQAGYRGRARRNQTETYYPRIYLSQAFDVLNEMTIAVTHSNKRQEHVDAVKLVQLLERNSVVIYDRAYLSKAILDAHLAKGSCFVFRCQRGATFKEIIEFSKSLRRQATWNYKGTVIRLIKIKSPRAKEDLILATNLTTSQMRNKEVGQLYCRRWSIETAFRDSVYQGLEQWHSRSENGLLQELFCHLWLMNFARLQLMVQSSNKATEWLKSSTYQKSNLKLLVEIMVECVPLILGKMFDQVLRVIDKHIVRTMQRRKHFSRSYGRVRKYSRKSFLFKNLVKRRPR
jgi:hypothetical protein